MEKKEEKLIGTFEIKLFEGIRVVTSEKTFEIREGGFPKLWEFFKWDIENDAEANECSLEIVRQFMMFGRVDLSALRGDGKTLIIEVIPTGE